jgi:hypothetical protein
MITNSNQKIGALPVFRDLLRAFQPSFSMTSSGTE